MMMYDCPWFITCKGVEESSGSTDERDGLFSTLYIGILRD